MLLAVHGRLCTIGIADGWPRARIMPATGVDVHHALISRWLAVKLCGAALGLAARFLRAECTPAFVVANIYHAVLSMIFAVHRCAVVHTVARSLRAGVVQATLDENVNHAVRCMIFAIQRPFAALHTKARFLRAGVLPATLTKNANHAVLSMDFAVRGRLQPFEVVRCVFGAGVMRTLPPWADVDHALISMFLAVRRRHIAGEVEARLCAA